MKKTTILDANSYKVKENENIYNFNTPLTSSHCYADRYDRDAFLKKSINKFSVKCQVKSYTSKNSADWNNILIYNHPDNYQLTPNSNMDVVQYDLFTGRTELITTYDRVYKKNDFNNYVETKTEYGYNDDNHEVELIRTFTSDGRVRQKNIYYTIDFIRTYSGCYNLTSTSTTNTEIINLVQNNIISLPVETSETIDDYHPGKYTYDKATIFTTLANGDIKPLYLLEARFNEPTIRNSPWPVESYGYKKGPLLNPASPDYSFYKIDKTFTYDATGNSINVKDEGGRQVSNLYGYSDKFIKAIAINAKPNEIFYDNLEEISGWSGTTSPTHGDKPVSGYDNSKSRTGSYSGRIDQFTSGERFCHSNKTLNISLTAPTLYKYTGWVYSNGPGVDIYLFMKTASATGYFTYVDYISTNATNQWVYLEKEFSVPANITKLNLRIDNNGGGSIWFDDIRLHPAASQMISYTYDPVLGKTSESDANNRSVNYEYDNVGRLRYIKDEDKNIVKMYEYNTVSKQNGCPGLYYNKLITENFTKNNCGAGYIGSTISYGVAANTYSSVISQADADAKAENFLLANGQNVANSGSCIQLYYNDLQSQSFQSESCGDGYIGGLVNYSVPANRYSSIINKSDANLKALAEIEANGQAYANDPVTAVCSLNTQPKWYAEFGVPTYCANINGQLPAHLFVWVKDINPNSSSYNQQVWKDFGPYETCPAGTYYNTVQSGSFTRNNCSSGYTGSTVTYTVPAGTYSSTTSLAAANQLGINDKNANGQAYANTNGTCTLNSCTYSSCGINGDQYRCVFGFCEMGYKVYTESYYYNNQYVCVYHYEWSDGMWSSDYTESTGGYCPL